MLEDEIQRAVQRTGAQMPIVWVDAGLHEYPDRLREELQRQVARLEQDYDTILLGFCLCGNALHGVRAARARLIAPRFDDCIRMLLCPAAGQAPAGRLPLSVRYGVLVSPRQLNPGPIRQDCGKIW